MVLAPAAEFVKEYRKTGKQGKLSLFINEDMSAALIDSDDVGRAAAHLIAFDDFSPYNQKRLVLNGPENITGAQVVQLVTEAYRCKSRRSRLKRRIPDRANGRTESREQEHYFQS
jgi:nucleoside-diphosphate-sugar epimerase